MAVVNDSFKYKAVKRVTSVLCDVGLSTRVKLLGLVPSPFRVQIISLDGRHTKIYPALHGGGSPRDSDSRFLL